MLGKKVSKKQQQVTWLEKLTSRMTGRKREKGKGSRGKAAESSKERKSIELGSRET